ncbi:hypothetical protein GCM10023195_50740 [Actinoallomurus liliacearum]|uniref:Uncharacterized protein n=1 Tax=Actinoallomurus liliacearum TaxID=1080073 RepID=A0ABP8TPN4_9ACTN
MTALPGSAEPFWFLGGQVRVLLPGRMTGGALSVMEFTDAAGPRAAAARHRSENPITKSPPWREAGQRPDPLGSGSTCRKVMAPFPAGRRVLSFEGPYIDRGRAMRRWGARQLLDRT